ncbi:MAG: hypothetical protein WBW84_12295 [Acidobacteriaceae bacterium]
MSTAVATPVPYYYSANVISSEIEPADLDTEIATQTSSAASDKSFEHRDWSVAPVLHDSDSFLSFLNEILTFNGEDDEDQISDDALGVALFTTIRAYAQKSDNWRKPRIATDGGGGVRLTWRTGDKEIRAVFPADLRRPHYLYVEEGDNRLPLINNFTAITLWDRLAWLTITR